jgi:purine-binding chemotaxis protein CheW
MRPNKQYCTFYLDSYLFGIEISKVQEVIQRLDLTEVPLSPSVVRGLMNLRGQIVIALDLRRQLELNECPPDLVQMNVVVRNGEDAVSLLFDGIGEVVQVGDETFEPPPETLRGRVRSVITGVHKLDYQLMHVLETERACDVTGCNERANLSRQATFSEKGG